MKLVLGSNGTIEATRSICNLSQGVVSEIYLSVLDSRFSSGRPHVAELTFQDLQEHLELARSAGIDLSVAFNAVCHSGRELSPTYQDQIRSFFKELLKVGVRRLIIAHPVLIILAKRWYPQFHVSVSSFNMIDNQTRIRYFREMGADRIILAAELNRNMEELQAILEKNDELEIEVIINNGCDYYCPFEYAHGSSQSHMHETTTELRSHYPTECIRYLLQEPWKILLSPFIRPEDIARYEAFGVQYFKIAGRNTTTDWMLHALQAYQDRSFQGNLIDILNRTYSLSRFRQKSAIIDIPNQKLENLLEIVNSCCSYRDLCLACKCLYYEAARPPTSHC